jgi:hypothetical protein
MTTGIPSYPQPLVDPETGITNQVWYKYLQSLGGSSAGGTVTNFSFTNANGFTGSVSNPTTTPTLELTYTSPSTALPLVVFVGDSLTADNVLLRASPASIFKSKMAGLGAECDVVNLAIDGYSFWTMLGGIGGTQFVPFGGQNVLQYCLSLKPALVIVQCGFNDTITDNESRTLLQVQGDATTFFAALKAGLPATSYVAYSSELPYDSQNFPTGTGLPNFAVVPYLHCWPSLGLLGAYACSENLTLSLTAAVQQLVANWIALDTTIKALPGINTSYTMNYFRLARLGLIGPDCLHPSAMGYAFEAGYHVKGISAASFAATLFPTLATQNYPGWNDPDSLFIDMLTTLAGGGHPWTNSELNVASALNMQDGTDRQLHPDTWYLPFKTKFTLNPTIVSDDPASLFTWTLSHGPPNSPPIGGTIGISINGGAFTATGDITNAEGFVEHSGSGYSAGLGVGTFTLRYVCVLGASPVLANALQSGLSGEVYGPFTFTITAGNGAAILANLGGAAATQPGFTTVTSFQNGWASAGAPYAPVSFMKDTLGKVTLRGLLTGGVLNNTAFTLPAGSRPAYSFACASGAGGVFGSVGISSGGAVQPFGGGGGQMSLDNISFWTLP